MKNRDFAKTIEILLNANLEEHGVGLGSHVKLVFSRRLELKSLAQFLPD